MKTCKIASTGRVGETSSKYGYPGGGEQFIEDCKAHEARYNFLWERFIEFMKTYNVTPSELRSMFSKYYEEFLN